MEVIYSNSFVFLLIYIYVVIFPYTSTLTFLKRFLRHLCALPVPPLLAEAVLPRVEAFVFGRCAANHFLSPYVPRLAHEPRPAWVDMSWIRGWDTFSQDYRQGKLLMFGTAQLCLPFFARWNRFEDIYTLHNFEVLSLSEQTIPKPPCKSPEFGTMWNVNLHDRRRFHQPRLSCQLSCRSHTAKLQHVWVRSCAHKSPIMCPIMLDTSDHVLVWVRSWIFLRRRNMVFSLLPISSLDVTFALLAEVWHGGWSFCASPDCGLSSGALLHECFRAVCS